MRGPLPLVLGVIATLALACSETEPSPSATPTPTGTPAERELVVFAAASLRAPFEALATSFEATHPGVDVTLAFAGSQELRAQLEAGAEADVIATADERTLETLRGGGLVEEGHVFARNEPVVIVAAHAASRVPSFEALPEAERVVLGVPEVPIGRYALAILDRASDTRPGFRARVEARVVSRELNVRQVLAKVTLGEADAGLVYRTDTLGAEGIVVRAVPADATVIARYPIAVLSRAPHPTLAAELVALVRGAEGRARLEEAGFLAPEGGP
jgi:molybdate transport system substrate-binding protein